MGTPYKSPLTYGTTRSINGFKNVTDLTHKPPASAIIFCLGFYFENLPTGKSCVCACALAPHVVFEFHIVLVGLTRCFLCCSLVYFSQRRMCGVLAAVF